MSTITLYKDKINGVGTIISLMYVKKLLMRWKASELPVLSERKNRKEEKYNI